MAQLLHFAKGNQEFVWIFEGDGDPEDEEEIAELIEDGYELAGQAELDTIGLAGMPTERPLRP